MITLAEAGKLGAVHIVRPGVLSLYLEVPLDPDGLRSLPARADDIIAAAEGAIGRATGRPRRRRSSWPG